MLQTPFYDPSKSYEENFREGPFGAFAPMFATGEVGAPILSGVGADSTKPKYDFLGFKVNSPFGIAAGPLINGKFVQAALDKSFDIVTYKTVRTRKYPCHPWPNVLAVEVPADLILGKEDKKLIANHNFTEPLSITNSFGVPSFDPEFWIQDIAEVVKNTRPGQIVVGAFQRTKKEMPDVSEYINDFVKAARLMKETGVRAMEVNFSCPNEGTSELLCYDVVRSTEVVKAIKGEIKNIPLIVKISYFKNDENLRDFVKEIGPLVQGISAINTIFSEIINDKGGEALPGRIHSGVCGHAIKWAGLDMVKRLKKIREEFNYSYQIIGVGGVMNADDFFEYRNAGADIVMSATGAMWNPYLAQEIKEKLR